MVEDPEPLRAVSERVGEVLENREVVVFLTGSAPTPRCRFSRRTLELVGKHREDFETVDTSDAPEAYRSVLSGYSDWTTIPQTYVEGEFVGDCTILAALEERGELAATLGAE